MQEVPSKELEISHFSAKLHEIIDRKLHRGETNLPREVLLNPDEKDTSNTKIDKKGVTIFRKTLSAEEKQQAIKASEETHQKVEEKSQAIHSLVEQLFNTYQTGVEPDEQYLEDVADLAIDYYRKDWHELEDEAHQKIKQERWTANKEQKMKEIIGRLTERNKSSNYS